MRRDGAAGAAAADRGHPGKYAITLLRSSCEGFLQFSSRRDLREKVFDAWIRRGENGGLTDNRALIAEMEAHGIPYSLEPFSLEELRGAREAFLTSATSFVKPIVKIDGHDVGDGKVGPVTRRLFDVFSRHVHAGLGNVA